MAGTHGESRPNTGVRVVVHAHHQLFLETLARALVARGHVVQAATRDPLVASALGSRHSPDVCLLDATEGTGWLEAARRLAARVPAVRTLVLSDAPIDAVRRAFDDGIVAAVVDRGCVFRQLDAALMRTVRGDGCLMIGSPGVDTVPAVALTLRERQVLEHLVRGAATLAIADDLGISPHTVRTHVQCLLRKLDVHARAGAVSVALALDLVEVRSA